MLIEAVLSCSLVAASACSILTRASRPYMNAIARMKTSATQPASIHEFPNFIVFS